MVQNCIEEPLSSESMILKWCRAQIAPWSSTSGFITQSDGYLEFLKNINENSHNIFILDFANGKLFVREKTNPHIIPALGSLEDIRIKLYAAFLAVVVERFKLIERFSIALCVGDIVENDSPYPVFGFQKKSHSRTVLLPDPDFIQFNFYQEEIAEANYFEKIDQVIFCGSSTGKMLTVDDVIGNCSERLHYAHRFNGSQEVIVKIGAATQCLTDEARRALEKKDYFCAVNWNEQLKRKYILSIDGNGATCSRVVLTLKSQSALLKVTSDDRLYYFDDLIPWKHFVPVNGTDDLEALSKKILSGSFNLENMVRDANVFYSNFLKKDRVEEYMFNLLLLFSKI